MKKPFELYDRRSRRRFITAEERSAFLDASHNAPAHQRSLCLVLTYTGCHLLEALQLTAADIDLAGDSIILAEHDRRIRAVPLPSSVITALDMIHAVRHAQKAEDSGRSAKLWPVDRTTAWRWILRIMKNAGIEGPQAAPRGLRQGFIVHCLTSGVPIETVQYWIGHKERATTEAYGDVLPHTVPTDT
jgi:integrase/recombinase XerD